MGKKKNRTLENYQAKSVIVSKHLIKPGCVFTFLKDGDTGLC